MRWVSGGQAPSLARRPPPCALTTPLLPLSLTSRGFLQKWRHVAEMTRTCSHYREDYCTALLSAEFSRDKLLSQSALGGALQCDVDAVAHVLLSAAGERAFAAAAGAVEGA